MGKTLKDAQNPHRKHRQPHWADKKCNGQKNDPVLWRVRDQNHYSEERNNAADNSVQNCRTGDNPNAGECEQVDGQNDWGSQ